jgi:uncharacterized protein (DUF169 family)
MAAEIIQNTAVTLGEGGSRNTGKYDDASMMMNLNNQIIII